MSEVRVPRKRLGYWLVGREGAYALPDQAGTLEVQADDGLVFRTMMGPRGARKAFRAQRTARQWAVTIPHLAPDDLALLWAIAHGHLRGPWAWVSTWSRVTNMLTPDQVGICGAGVPAGVVPTGATALIDDRGVSLQAATSGANVSTANFSVAREMPVPVVQGQPTTATAFVRTIPGASLRFISIWFRRANGSYIPAADGGQPTATVPVSTNGPLVRVAVSASNPPIGAVSAEIRMAGIAQYAYPAFTWTLGPLEFGYGSGTPEVLIHGLAESLQRAHIAPGGTRRAAASFTVSEVFD